MNRIERVGGQRSVGGRRRTQQGDAWMNRKIPSGLDGKGIAPSETTATKVSQGRQRRPSTIYRSYGTGKGAEEEGIAL